MLLGSHLSIAGGLRRPLELAHGYGFDTVAMFLRNQRQWRCRPMARQEAELFRRTRRRLGIGPVVAHGSYLLNLAAIGVVRRKTIQAVKEDLRRCAMLGIEYLVLHPGSCPHQQRGIVRIAAALNAATAGSVPGRRGPAAPGRRRSARRGGGPKILLETTAGQGNSLGHTFEQLAEVLGLLSAPELFGVCLDTCHVFAAGYDIRRPEAYARTMGQFDQTIGLGRLLAIHLNDSVRPLGSRIDRHAHIGRGRIGLAGFANFVNDPRLAAVPMILETPKQTAPDGRQWDEVNAETVRSLAGRRRLCRGRPARE